MRGVRKHVHHAGGLSLKPWLVHQNAGIARQTARMARNVHHAPRAGARDHRQHFLRARARRIEQHLVVWPRAQDACAIRLVGEIGREELGVRARPLRSAFARARATRPASPSTPTTCAPLRASGSEKLPRPQNRSSTRSSVPGASSATARAIICAFSAPFTWTKSVGRNCSVTSNSGKPILERRASRRRAGRRSRSRRAADTSARA